MDSRELVAKYPFLTKDYLEDILRNEKRDTCVMVEDYSVNRALGKGENFSSDILRIRIVYKRNHEIDRVQSYILKVALVTEGMAAMLEEYDVFHREIIFYKNILPKIEELLKMTNYQKKLAPSCHRININDPKHFVFEDLAQDGFKAANRKIGLDYRQLELLLEKVAKFHATTSFIYRQNKDIMKHHHYRNVNEEVHHFYTLFRNSMVVCAEMAETWPTTSPTIARKLYDLERTVISKACQVYTVDDSSFNVLNHGDLWVNNVMYKYEESGSPTEAILVDYAISYFGSPGIDLSFLLFTSSSNEVSTDDFDSLVQYYYKHLMEHLQCLGVSSQEVPTLLDIQMEVLRKGFIGVMYSTFLIPLRLIEDTANADLGNLLGSTEEAMHFRRQLFKHPKYQERMEYLLNYYDRKGFLD
ncbi:uncharacterized protein LOC131681334 [Topomyia yanbarensis]|uniref:uncharacterized protein LOC131681334 n=1 Tax=Topomyia yanbarensis TaxID=2498891 RepID=UPI00273AF444|nr:uncharacterized protein LOC131681334 [Topomyia yanbarensis]